MRPYSVILVLSLRQHLVTRHLCLWHLGYEIIYQGIYENLVLLIILDRSIRRFFSRKHFILDKVFVVIYSLITFK